jgi:hypothetical protein
MAASNESGTGDSTTSTSKEPDDRLKKLYPAVNEEETPLPRSWSAKDKFNYLGLSQNNLRVHYKGTQLCFGFDYETVNKVDLFASYLYIN